MMYDYVQNTVESALTCHTSTFKILYIEDDACKNLSN